MLAYILFRTANAAIGYLPYVLLYRLSDMLAWILQYVVRYRKAVVDGNLKACFPELPEKEISLIRKESYKNLATIFLESFKGNVFSLKELRERFVFENPEILNPDLEAGKDVILVAGHFNNWEWAVLAFNLCLPYQTIGVYKPLKNKRINAYLDKVRTRTGMILVPIRETRSILDPHDPPPRMFIFVADQSPSNMEKAIWVDFLGRPTPCLHGPEKYARTLSTPVYFASILRVRQGYYKVNLDRITGEDADLEYGEITKRFMKVLEKDVLDSPGSWLWSHKRWKRVGSKPGTNKGPETQ